MICDVTPFSSEDAIQSVDVTKEKVKKSLVFFIRTNLNIIKEFNKNNFRLYIDQN